MIRGVAVVFGLVAIVVLITAGAFVVVRALDWWHRRRELRRLELRRDNDRRSTGDPR